VCSEQSKAEASMTLLSVQLQGHIHKVAKLRLKFLLSRKNRGKLEKGKKKNQ
jgi:hypothetical protein